MNVVDKMSGIFISFDEVGFVSALEEMAVTLVLAIVSDCVGCLEPGEGLREVCSRGLDNKMVMIGHEAIAMQDDTETLQHGLECFKEELMVCVGSKDLSALVATGNNVVAGSLILDAYGSCHGAVLAGDYVIVSSVKR